MLTSIKQKLAQSLTALVPKNCEEIYNLLEYPKEIEHGHLALPVFFLAKELKKAPPLIAIEMAEKIRNLNDSNIEKVSAAGGYVNIQFKDEFLQNNLTDAVYKKGNRLGYKDSNNKKVVIDFSSPNIAKPMHLGTLRATVIGQAIKNLATTQGYQVEAVNHIGDWGTQFGKLAWAYKNWGQEYDLSEKPIDALLKMYVRFHDEAEKNPELEKWGSETFKKLEDGDSEIRNIWQKLIDYSFKDYNRIYKMLGTKHDQVLGESFYNDKLKNVEDRLMQKNLLQESDGAQVVFFDEKDQMPPCIIKKGDGASIYATRDLAAAIYRHEVQKADSLLYVVGQDQALHFKQVFKVLEKLGYAWAKNCHHIGFGLYKFKEGKMSTRKGQVILLDDIISKAIELVSEIIKEKNPELSNKAVVAEQVAVGAIIFNDLVNDRMKDVDFDWDRILDFNGDSGPYVQYCLVRCKSLIKKFNNIVPDKMTTALSSKEERALVRLLLQFQDTLTLAFSHYKPHILVGYLIDVCHAFNQFYQQHKVISESEPLTLSRMALVFCTQRVLEQGLQTLNIPCPEQM